MKKKILFGSGQLGNNALMLYGEDHVHCFVDNNPSKTDKVVYGKKIISFQELLDIYNEAEFEVIISCFAFDAIANQLTQAGIKTFRKFSPPIIYDYVTSVKSIMPKELVTSIKLDVVVRYLYAKDIINGIKDSPNKSLYARMMLIRTGCSDESMEKKKEGLDMFFRDFENLCKNMQREGFNEKSFIPIAKDNFIYDGAHRLATALALNEEVNVGICGESAAGYNTREYKWFEENGFSFEDKVRILRGFSDLYDECGIFLLFGTIQEQWVYVKAQLEKEFRVVGNVDIDLSHNFIAFEILIREIYGDYYSESVMLEKMSLLKMAPLRIRVILISNEMKKLERSVFYKSITDFKLRMRDILDYDVKKDSYSLFHACSYYNEFIYLKNIVLSVNNLRSIEGRISPEYRNEFIRRVLFVRDYCIEKEIPIEEVCVIGSSTMEVLGIKKTENMIFSISSDFYTRVFHDYHEFSSGVNGLPDKVIETDKTTGKPLISISPCTKIYYTTEGEKFKNDNFIHNDSYHILFNGLKFVNLKFIIQEKSFSNYDNDKIDLRLIELYNDFIRNFDDKKILKKQIEIELKKREERNLK